MYLTRPRGYTGALIGEEHLGEYARKRTPSCRENSPALYTEAYVRGKLTETIGSFLSSASMTISRSKSFLCARSSVALFLVAMPSCPSYQTLGIETAVSTAESAAHSTHSKSLALLGTLGTPETGSASSLLAASWALLHLGGTVWVLGPPRD